MALADIAMLLVVVVVWGLNFAAIKVGVAGMPLSWRAIRTRSLHCALRWRPFRRYFSFAGRPFRCVGFCSMA